MTAQQALHCSSEASARSNFGASIVFHWLPLSSFLFLTVSAGSSAYRSRRNPPEVAFILVAYVDLVALLVSLVRFQQLQRPGDDAGASLTQERERLKAAVCSTALNLAFAWRVADLMPPPLAAVVWVMAAAFSVGGFYGPFIYDDRRRSGGQCCGPRLRCCQKRQVANEEKL